MDQESRTPNGGVHATPKRKEASAAQIAANRLNLAKAMAARQAAGYKMTEARLAACRINIRKGREVYRRTIHSLTPEERVRRFQKNLNAAREELDENGQNLWHGMTCASLEGSLRAAGEKVEDLQEHFARFKNALRPRDEEEEKIVNGLAELLWRRVRGLRLGGRWEARKLAAVLGKRRGGAPPPPGKDDDAETAADRAADRGEYAEALAYDILQVFERAARMAKGLGKIQRHMLILVRSFGRRCGEPLLGVFNCGEKREQQVTRRGEDTIGNPFAPPSGDGRPATGGGHPQSSDGQPSTGGNFNQRHQEVSNVKGLGKAALVAGPAAFSAAFIAAMGTMNEEALRALKDLAEAVCARLRLLEEESLKEAAELVELLTMAPERVQDEARGPLTRPAPAGEGAGSGPPSPATGRGSAEQGSALPADLPVGATEDGKEDRKEQGEISREARNDRVDGNAQSDDGPARRGNQGQDARGTNTGHETAEKRWRGFRAAQEILKSRIRGTRKSKAFGVCLSLGLVDIILAGDNRLVQAQHAMEEAVLTFMDRWMAGGAAGIGY